MDAHARRRLSADLARLAAGEREAFDPVFTALWPPLRSLAERLLGPGSEAEDAAQEALMKVLSTVQSYDPARDGLSWAFAITAFEARTLRQRRLRRRESAGALPDHPDSASPEGALADAELRARLAQAIDLLSPADRDEIAAYLQLAPDEVGAAATRSPAQRKRRQRALDRLRRIWRSLHGFHA